MRRYRLVTMLLPAPSGEHVMHEFDFDAPEGFVLDSWRVTQGANERDFKGTIVEYGSPVAAILWRRKV